jgi:hypothetical protein
MVLIPPSATPPLLALAMTYSFTAFCVGNKISLGDVPPKSTAVDLFAAFSFNNRLDVTSEIFALSASPDDKSAALAFKARAEVVA